MNAEQLIQITHRRLQMASLLRHACHALLVMLSALFLLYIFGWSLPAWLPATGFAASAGYAMIRYARRHPSVMDAGMQLDKYYSAQARFSTLVIAPKLRSTLIAPFKQEATRFFDTLPDNRSYAPPILPPVAGYVTLPAALLLIASILPPSPQAPGGTPRRLAPVAEGLAQSLQEDQVPPKAVSIAPAFAPSLLDTDRLAVVPAPDATSFDTAFFNSDTRRGDTTAHDGEDGETSGGDTTGGAARHGAMSLTEADPIRHACEIETALAAARDSLPEMTETGTYALPVRLTHRIPPRMRAIAARYQATVHARKHMDNKGK